MAAEVVFGKLDKVLGGRVLVEAENLLEDVFAELLDFYLIEPRH